MEITLKVRIDTGDATREQTEHLPEELRRFVEQTLIEWSPTPVRVTVEDNA